MQTVIRDIQQQVSFNVPIDHATMFDAFNTEWDEISGQAWEMKNFINLVKNKYVLVDVGGFIGTFSFVFCKRPNTESYYIEPSPYANQHFQDINSVIDIDGNIYPYRILVGEQTKFAPVLMEEASQTILTRFEKENEGDYGFKAPEGNNGTELFMMSLDQFCSEAKDYGQGAITPDTVKIDVEGYEANVLIGARSVLTNLRPLIFLEVHNSYLHHYGHDVKDVFNILQLYNYKIYDLQMNRIESRLQFIEKFFDRNEVRFVCVGD